MKLKSEISHFIWVINAYRVPIYAASASFFFITSLLPLLTMLLAALSRIRTNLDAEFLARISELMPEALQDALTFVVQNLPDIGGAELSVSVIILIWTASNSMTGLLDGLNNIAGFEANPNIFFKRFICLGYTIVLMAGLLATLGLRVFGHKILEFLQKYLPYVGDTFSAVMEFRGFTLFLLITITITLIYSIFPNKKMNFIKQIPGAAIAAAAWLIFSGIYSLYVTYVSASLALYGGLGIAILTMLWVYFCINIIFIGAVFNKEYPDVMPKLLAKIKPIVTSARTWLDAQKIDREQGSQKDLDQKEHPSN